MKPREKTVGEILDDSLGLFSNLTSEEIESSREQALKYLQSEAGDGVQEVMLDSDPVRPVRRWHWRAVAAMTAAAAIAIAVLIPMTMFRKEPTVPEAALEAKDGARRIEYGEVVRSNGGPDDVLALADGSRVEMRSQTELALERAEDGVRIRLNKGGILVSAAKQRKGHLYVETKDVMVSVVGTVFLVNAEEEGSRVAVIEGEVRVQQGATEKKLRPGDQVTTNPLMERQPVSKEIAWSREAEAHMVLLQQALGPQQVRDGLVEVTVRDAATREPIVGARVALIFLQTPPPNIVTNINTDENGKVVFKDQPHGNYGVSMERDGYITPNPIRVQDFTIGADKQQYQLDLTLSRGATLTGRVLGPDGAPVVQAQVEPWSLTYPSGRRVLGQAAGVPITGNVTDDRGEYRLTGIPPGQYYVRAEIPNKNGSFPRIFYPGVLDSMAAVPLTLRGPEELSAIDIKIPDAPVFKVSGAVITPLPAAMAPAGGQPLPAVTSFFIGSADPNSFEDAIEVSARSKPGATPDETRFEIAGVMPGIYYLYPMLSRRTGTLGYANARALVTVDDHDVENVRIVLKPNPEVKGRLVVVGDASAVNWDSIRIGIRPKDGVPTRLPGLAASARISDPKTGEFTISAAPEDVRFIPVISGLPQDAYVSDVRQEGRSVYGEALTANVSDGPVEIRIALQGGTIQGSVREGLKDAPVRGTVVLVPSAPRRGNSQLYRRTVTNANGQFTIRGVAPGDYKVFAWPTPPLVQVWPSPPLSQPEENEQFIAQYESRGVSVTVTAGGTANAQPILIPAP